ncbi:hypothetical protein DVH24_030153 [Malus domestica]|uniref:Ferredoxin n=1 Tax=Malus domestica TaxID=3750 RepID=A0A498HZM8_MALDO|nr:hypothetical protein DVH24_030153 [Malus domestica]
MVSCRMCLVEVEKSPKLVASYAMPDDYYTSGAVRLEALGISTELKSNGYALLCMGYPSSDLEVETQEEDEICWLQFGRYFARGLIEKDDYALKLAMGNMGGQRRSGEIKKSKR